MNNSEPDAFLNMMSFVSDYPKFIMMEKFLEGKPLTVKSFTNSDLHLPCRAVYQNLRKWRNWGILSIEQDSGPDKTYKYRLNAEKLLEKLS